MADSSTDNGRPHTRIFSVCWDTEVAPEEYGFMS